MHSIQKYVYVGKKGKGREGKRVQCGKISAGSLKDGKPFNKIKQPPSNCKDLDFR